MFSYRVIKVKKAIRNMKKCVYKYMVQKKSTEFDYEKWQILEIFDNERGALDYFKCLQEQDESETEILIFKEKRSKT